MMLHGATTLALLLCGVGVGCVVLYIQEVLYIRYLDQRRQVRRKADNQRVEEAAIKTINEGIGGVLHLRLVRHHSSAQYLSARLIDLSIKRHLRRTTGGGDTFEFEDRLREFVHAVLLTADGAAIRPEFRDDCERLQQWLPVSSEDVLRRLRDVGPLASELDVMLNIAHIRTCRFGQVPVDSLAAIALICAALQRDAVDGFPHCVY